MARRVQRCLQRLGQFLRRRRSGPLDVDSANQTRRLLNLRLGPDVGERWLPASLLGGAVGLAGLRLLDDVADVELQPPAIVTFLGDTVEFQCADLGTARRQGNWHAPGAAALAAAQDR